MSYCGNSHSLYLFHFALPLGKALLHSLFSFSPSLVGICHEALKIRRNRLPGLGGDFSGNWRNSRFHYQRLSLR